MLKILQHNLALSILSGALLAVSFPFSGSITPLIFVAWIPLFVVALRLKDQFLGWLRFYGYAYLTLLLFNIGTTWWIWNSTAGGALMAFMCNSILMAGALVIGFGLFKRLTAGLFLIGLGSIWISFEFIHFNWELSWPWLTMGNYFSTHPSWVQWYEYTGTWVGGFWLIAINILGVLLLLNRKSVLYSAALVMILAAPIILSLFLNNTIECYKNPTQSIVILQPNIDPYTEKFNIDPAHQVESMLGLVRPYLHNTLAIGPETALQEAFIEQDFNRTRSFNLLNDALTSTNSSLLIGASTFQLFNKKHSAACKALPNGSFYESYNTALYMGNQQQQFIHKSKLVLGVEKIPFSNIFPFLETLAIQNGGTSGTLGVESEASIFQDKDFEGKGFGLAPVVCYESIYGAYLADQTKKGSNLICILTNDGWWGDSPGYKQHFSFSRLRAIENRRWVVRSANTGYSGVIDDYGTILKQTNYWEEAVFSNSVPLKYSTTFYVKWGDYLGVIGIGISLLLLLFSIYLRFKKAS